MVRAMIRLLMVLAALAAPASARAPEVAAELLPGWRIDGGRHMAALRLDLPAGWKTYWRTPGEAGVPLVTDWAGSPGVTSAHVHWPAPSEFSSYGMRFLGYEGEVVLPVELGVRGARPALDVTVGFGVCREICIPMAVRLRADLPARGARDPAIAAALARVPARRSGIATCAAGPGGALDVRVGVPSLGAGESLALEAPGAKLGAPDLRREGASLLARVPVLGGFVSRAEIRVTAFGPAGAVEQMGCPAPSGQ